MTTDEAIGVLKGLTAIAWYHGHSVNTPDRGAEAMRVLLDERDTLTMAHAGAIRQLADIAVVCGEAGVGEYGETTVERVNQLRAALGNALEMEQERRGQIARLAARVAELEASLDRAERLAAEVAARADEAGKFWRIRDAYFASEEDALAAVRAVTRAATPADAPPHATQGEGER